MLFQGYKDVFITVYILILSTLTGLPYSFVCTFQRVLKLQLSLQSVHLIIHRYSVSSTGCPLKLEFPVIACLCFNAVASFTLACLSDLLQLYCPSRSLHSCTGIRLLPLPPCRCRTGGDCAFSRLGHLSGAHCHFTSGMQQPSIHSSWLSVVSLRPRII